MKCDLCNGELRAEPVHPVVTDRRKGLRGSWQVLECSRCEALCLHPRPGDEELRTYYAQYADGVVLQPSAGIGSRFPTLRRLYHLLSGDVDPRDLIRMCRGKTLLDYGCGGGSYLSYFRSMGAQVYGVEIAQDAVDASVSRGLDVRLLENVDRLPFPDSTFDVVYLMQVFEHLSKPRGVLDEIRRVMRPDGILLIAVPNARSSWRGLFGLAWVSGWFAPYHLFHYSATSLTSLAAQHGLRALRIWSRTPESWFRLNIKALLHPSHRQLDRESMWIDLPGVRHLIMIALRITEVFLKERDCLVVTLQKDA